MANVKKHALSGFIIKLATAATALSVAVMIIAFSFVNGFQQVISEKVFSFWGHIRVVQDIEDKISIAEEMPIHRDNEIENFLSQYNGVVSVDRFATKSSILKSDEGIESVLFKGIDQDYNKDRYLQFLKQGKMMDFGRDNYSTDIVISEQTAHLLNVKVNDPLIVFFFKSDGNKVTRKLTISGIYKTSIEEYDKNFALCDIRLIQRLNQWEEDQIGGYELFLSNNKNITPTNYALYEELPQTWYSRSIYELYPTIFDWLKFQGQLKVILLIIMVVIAAVNLVTCLIILVLERTKMIGTLKAVGAPDTLLQKVFLFNTFKIALRGILIGAIVGLLICYIQQFTGFIKLNEKEYYIDKAEVLIHYGQVIAIMLGTLIVCMVTLIIPTLIIRKVNIVKAITFR